MPSINEFRPEPVNFEGEVSPGHLPHFGVPESSTNRDPPTWLFDRLSGSDLDLIAGSWYRVHRRGSETDEEFRSRITERARIDDRIPPRYYLRLDLRSGVHYLCSPDGAEVPLDVPSGMSVTDAVVLVLHARLPTAWEHLLREDGL